MILIDSDLFKLKYMEKMVAGVREERIDESGKKTSPATMIEYRVLLYKTFGNMT